ncbi:hypothetical protein STEG23_010531, partial [Scotinomys teguina]
RDFEQNLELYFPGILPEKSVNLKEVRPDLPNKRNIIPGTGNVAYYPGLVKSQIFKNQKVICYPHNIYATIAFGHILFVRNLNSFQKGSLFSLKHKITGSLKGKLSSMVQFQWKSVIWDSFVPELARVPDYGG